MINRTELPSPRAVWVFLGVVEAGGFRKGAALLGMAQPVVSSTIRRLEEDLGLTLFVEVGRRKVLSPAGKEFLAVARPALDEWARIEDRVKEALEGRPRGCLRVGAGESSLLYLLPKPVSAFRRRCPEVELQLVSQPHEESLTMLREGSLDLAVRSLSRPTPGMSSQALRRVRRVFITARSNGPTLGRRPAVAELAELPFVLPHRKSTTRAALEGALAGRACRVALEAGGWEAVKLYVAQGIGVGLVPEIVVTPGDRRRLVTIPADHLFESERYGVLWPADRPLSKAAQAMRDTLEEHGVRSSL